MKKLLSLFLLIFCLNSAFSQNQDSIKALADAAVKSFTWKIQKTNKGPLLYLDVPYNRVHHDSVEYLTIIAGKNKNGRRPQFITIFVPDNVDHEKGISIKFAKTRTKENGERVLEMEKASPVRVKFISCDKGDCKARIPDGYVVDEKSKVKIDIYQKFLDFDHVLILLEYPDGSHKSVSVPLFSFKKQIKKFLK